MKATATGRQVRWLGFASWQWTLGLALLVLGFLIAAQLQSETPRTTYTSQERQPLVQTALELQGQQDQLKQRVLDLRAQIQQLEQRSHGNQTAGQALNDELQQARIAAGLVGLRGTGLVIQLEDSTNTIPVGANETDYRVSAADVRTVVQELWLAGAEAIAVNGERVTVSSGLIDIGGSVLLNSAYLAPPYQVSAIGPTDLYGRLTQSPAFVGFVRARADTFGIKISYAQPAEVTVPAFAGSVTLRYGRPEQPGASASPAAP
ncbi:MAG TPA: DUF881 domain-containing protein [Candidatus Acidoferrum sp.]|nr:DUF881 domain-containing protein [Candidatus Acidoferrum sp.]